MTRLTIDPSCTVRTYDDDGQLLSETRLADRGVTDQVVGALESADDEDDIRGGWWITAFALGLSTWGLIVGVGLILLHIGWS